VGGWDGGGNRPGAKAPLHDQRIGDGEVVRERFIGPLAGRVGRRAKAGRCGGEPQVGEDLPDDRRALDDGDDLHAMGLWKAFCISLCVSFFLSPPFIGRKKMDQEEGKSNSISVLSYQRS